MKLAEEKTGDWYNQVEKLSFFGEGASAFTLT
jgi:hypothetical protein